MAAVQISGLRAHVGETITVRGWVVTTRSSGKIAFVVVRDGSGTVQGVLSKKEVPESTWAAFESLTQETSVAVTGVVREEARSPGGHELALTECRGPGRQPGLPDHAQGARDARSSSSTGTSGSEAAARWPSPGCATRWCRRSDDFFYQRDFILVDTPILTGSIGEEAGNLFATDVLRSREGLPRADRPALRARPLPRPTARSTASVPRSAPRSRRPGAT